MKIILIIVSLLFLTIKPFYIFPSGLPQIADIISLLLFLFVCINYIDTSLNIKDNNHYLKKIDKIMLFYLFLFVSYAVIVNCFWFFAIKVINLTPMYYVYNYMLFFSLIYLNRKCNNFYKLYYISFFINVFMLSVFSWMRIGRIVEGRYQIFFNDPNQLGYFSLISFLIFYIVYTKHKTNYFIFLISATLSCYLIFVSMSRSALVGLICILFFVNQFRFSFKTIMNYLSIILVICISFWFLKIYNPDSYELLIERIVSTGHDLDDSFSGRGYDRIQKNWDYLLFGASEIIPRNNVFIKSEFGGEIHSSWATIFFSYGIIGSIFFILFLKYLIYSNTKNKFFVLLPLILFGITTNGIRNSYLWIFLSLLYFYDYDKKGYSL